MNDFQKYRACALLAVALENGECSADYPAPGHIVKWSKWKSWNDPMVDTVFVKYSTRLTASPIPENTEHGVEIIIPYETRAMMCELRHVAEMAEAVMRGEVPVANAASATHIWVAPEANADSE